MWSSIGIFILLLIALAIFLKGTVPGEDGNRIRIWPVGIIFLVLAFIWTLFACLTVVQPKDVGVLTSLGHVSDRTLSSGPHIKTPWQSVTSIDGTVQTDKYSGENCIPVRIGDGSNSCLSITHRWQIVPERANETYANYRSDDPTQSLRDAVVETQLASVAQDVLSKYNPIASLKVVDQASADADLNFAPDYTQVALDITNEMDSRYGTEPLVKTVAITVSGLSLSKSTQAKVDAFIAEVANTRIAVQKQQTAEAEAIANGKLEASVTNAPNVLVSKCLDLIAEGQKIDYTFPAGFSCWPGSGGSVVVPSSK